MNYARTYFDADIYPQTPFANSFANQYELPLVGLYVATSIGRFFYNRIDAYANFYEAISKSNKPSKEHNPNQINARETESLLDRKNIKRVLTPYGNLYINGLKQSFLMMAEFGLVMTATIEPTLYPIAPAIELYRVGSAFYSIGNSAYGFFTQPVVNTQKNISDENAQKSDWLVSGLASMLIDNTLHAVTIPFCLLVDLYAVTLAIQSWKNGAAPDNAQVEPAKVEPLLFAKLNKIDEKLSYLLDAKNAQTEEKIEAKVENEAAQVKPSPAI